MLHNTGEEKSLLTKVYSSKVKLFFRAVFLKILTKSEPLQNVPRSLALFINRNLFFRLKLPNFCFNTVSPLFQNL